MFVLTPFSLNFRHLRGLAALVATGSVTGAADRVMLSQPALTQALAKLETQLGLLLHVRKAGGIEVTAAARSFATRIERAMTYIATTDPGDRTRRTKPQPEKQLTTAQLRAYLALADAGGLSDASKRSGLAQATLHRAVRDVEAAFGSTLLERRGRRIAFNARGLDVARGLRLAVAEIAAGLSELGTETRAQPQPVRVGAMPMARARLLPLAIARSQGSRATTHVIVVDGGHRELLEQLRSGHLDIIVGALREPSPGPDVVQQPLFRDRLSIVARAGHPAIQESRASLARLREYPWIVNRSGTPLRAQWERLFSSDDGTLPSAPVECGSAQTICGLLLAGDYLTILSPDQIWHELDAGRLALVGVPLDDGERTIGVTYRAEWQPTMQQRLFFDGLVTTAAEIMR